MAILSGSYICEICNNVVNWAGFYQAEYEFITSYKREKDVAQVRIKPSTIPSIHCIELDCPFCGKHKELVIKNGKQIDIDNLNK